MHILPLKKIKKIIQIIRRVLMNEDHTYVQKSGSP